MPSLTLRLLDLISIKNNSLYQSSPSLFPLSQLDQWGGVGAGFISELWPDLVLGIYCEVSLLPCVISSRYQSTLQ